MHYGSSRAPISSSPTSHVAASEKYDTLHDVIIHCYKLDIQRSPHPCNYNFKIECCMRNCLLWKCTNVCDLCHSLPPVILCPSHNDNNKLISMLLCCDLLTRNVPAILINLCNLMHCTYYCHQDNKPHTHIHPHIYSCLSVILISLKGYRWCWRIYGHCLRFERFLRRYSRCCIVICFHPRFYAIQFNENITLYDLNCKQGVWYEMFKFCDSSIVSRKQFMACLEKRSKQYNDALHPLECTLR